MNDHVDFKELILISTKREVGVLRFTRAVLEPGVGCTIDFKSVKTTKHKIDITLCHIDVDLCILNVLP